MNKLLLALAAASASPTVFALPSSTKHCVGPACQTGMDKNSRMPPVMRRKMAEHAACHALSEATHGEMGCPTIKPSINHRQPCENGQSGEYDCENVDLLSFVGV